MSQQSIIDCIPWLFVGANLAVLCRWRILPAAFRIAVLMWLTQSIVCSIFHPDSLYWRIEIWMPLEHYNILLTAAAALQSMRMETERMPQPDRFWVRFGGAVLFAYCLRLWYLEFPAPALPLPPEAGSYLAFLHVRQAVQLATAVLLLATRWLVELVRVDSPCRVHGRIFCVLATTSAVVGPLMRVSRDWWFIEQNVYRLVVFSCCAAWVIFTPAGGWPAGTAQPSPSPGASLRRHFPGAIGGSGGDASSPQS